MNSTYDVIVIGAGPAGSMAALEAAKGGAKTLLLEKHSRVGQPVCCAEGITTAGLERIIKPQPEWIAAKISAARLDGPGGASITFYHTDAGYILNRGHFDDGLAQLAVASGTDLSLSSPAVGLAFSKSGKISGVRVRRDGRENVIEAKVFIAADGVESRVASMAGIDTRLGLDDIASACQYLVNDFPVDSNTVAIVLGNDIAPGGYAWIFPKSASSANVGVAVSPPRTGGRSAREYLDAFIKSRYDNYVIAKTTMGVVPAFDREIPLVKGNLMLVGDAARLLDSLSQAGISNSLISGSIAGKIAARFCRSQAALAEYPREFMRLKSRELRAYRLFRSLLVRATDRDFRDIIDALDRYFPEKKVRNINVPDIIFKLVIRNPGLLKMARYLIAR